MAATSFRTSDVDEANAIVNEVFFESHLEPRRETPLSFQFAMKVNSAGPLTFGILSHECEISARIGGLDMTYGVGVALKGTFPVQFGHEDLAVDPFTAAVHTPTSHLNYQGYHTGTERLFALTFNKEALDNHLRNLLGRDRISTIKLAPTLDLRTGRGAQWWRLTSSLVLDLQSPIGLATNPLMTAQLSSAVMTGLLLATDHPYRDALDAWTQPVPPAAIRKARDIIETRAHEPLTIPEIAAEIGCSVSALQLGYRKHLNMTPREHIGRVRMDRAHTMLKSAHPDATTVVEVAAMCGFHHPGRFAAGYRKLYGVYPQETLRGS